MAQPTLRSHSCWLYSGQCCPFFPNQPSSPPTSAVAAGLGLVHDTVLIHSLDAQAHFLWGGYFLQLVPRQCLHAGWGCLGLQGVRQAGRMAEGLCSPHGSQKPMLPSSSVSSLSGSRKDLMTGTLPALQPSLPLGSTHTLTSHTEPLQVSPALPHHTTNGPQSPADQSCTTVETRSALPMPTSLNHS